MPIGRVFEEAVFSSSEDRIRPKVAIGEAAGRSIVSPSVGISKDTPSTSTLFNFQELQSWIRRASAGVFSVLFPSDCRICGEPLLNVSRLPVCPECLEQMAPIPGHVCSICGERVLSAYAAPDDDGLCRCPACRRIDRPFARAVAYGSYDDGLRELIHLLKFNGVHPAAGVLGRMLAEAISGLEPCFEQDKVLVIPVPLYRGKRRQRGFNQAELIAATALRLLALPRLELQIDILRRTRDTHSQIGLTSHQRRENLRGAFAVSSAPEVTGREILLVDDVYTTGTTVSECAKVLRRAGAAQVWVATVARTLKLASKEAGKTSFRVSGSQSFKDKAEPGETAESIELETLKL